MDRRSSLSSDVAESVQPVLQLKNIARRYGDFIALDKLSLYVQPGEFVSILGPSGSGKTTTLNLIAGFDQPTSGTIIVAGRDVTDTPAYDRRMGMVFQNYALFPHMTVFENVAFPLRSQRVANREIESRVRKALELVQLSDSANRFPRQLSGGQQQRIAFARATIYHPPILLMDEPLGALDRRLRYDMQVEIKRLHRQLGVTVLYVTHDQDEALSMSDRIAILHRGKLMQIGPPRDVYWKPTNRFTAGFIGEINFIESTIGADGASIDLPLLQQSLRAAKWSASPGAQVVVAIRPENLVVGSPLEHNRAVATVEDALFFGDSVKVLLRVKDILLTGKASSHSGTIFRIGDTVSVSANFAAVSVFNREDGEILEHTSLSA